MWAATFIGSWASDSFLNLQGNSYLDRLNFFPSSLPSVRRSILAQTQHGSENERLCNSGEADCRLHRYLASNLLWESHVAKGVARLF